MKPSVEYSASSASARVGEDARTQHDRRHARRSYDSRNDYPPPPPPDNGRPSRPQRPTTWRRYSWPPSPTVEDEAVSLAKEAGTQLILKEIGKDEARSRGTIDQEPVVEEVPGIIDRAGRKAAAVALDSKKEAKSTRPPTPPISDEERSRRARRRPSKINTDVDNGAPDFAQRTSSPYAFTRPSKMQRDVSSSDRFLSPDVLTPPASGTARRQSRYSVSSKPSSPRRDSARLSPNARRGNDYFAAGYNSNDNAIMDDDGNTSDSASRDSRRQTTRPPSRGQDYSTSPRTSIIDFAAAPTDSSRPPRRQHLEARRNTDTASTLPKLRMDKTRRASPLMTGSALSDFEDSAIYSAPGTPGADLGASRSRDSSTFVSRGVSPASAVSARSTASYNDPSPSNPKRYSADMSDRASVDGSPKSSSSSRPPSPSPRTSGESPRLPRTDVDWSALLAANAARRNRPTQPSRLASSMRQESMSDVRPPPLSSTGRRVSGLPYPMEDGPSTPSAYMPPEREQHYFATSKATLSAPFQEAKTLSRATSPAPNGASRATKLARPPLQTRHSVANTSSAEERPRFESRPAVPDTSQAEERPRVEPRHKSFSASPDVKRELAALLKKGLPDCRRPDAVAGYDDWYTVIGAPALTFCPDCVEQVFDRTIYRPTVRRMPQLNYTAKVKCALGASAWMRLAWLLTLQQQRTDLKLLKDLAEIDETHEPCPGAREAVRSWYGLRDDEGLFVRAFHICPTDVAKTTRLLPTLTNFFVRLPARVISTTKRPCALATTSNRFPAYLDGLLAVHDKASTSRHLPDPNPLIDLIERKTRLRDCPRDTLLQNALWHYHPKIPSFTVCEDCFDAVIEPEIKRGSDFASRFSRTLQPVRGGGAGDVLGASCQLYSTRMRTVFRRALQDRDLAYLARKAGERRSAELRLQERYREVLRRARRVSSNGGGGGGGSGSEDDERLLLERDLRRISEEWRGKWE
ncbi:hypothetical protein B0A50_01128 [Salinomyces thailandicus]|uniref:Uncharacterized protein n=1 Tax=Salinomyces thailandicus TaxID=706561 RepID=A0A4U0UDM9_9PEZI|nr:hypothetical protein B0A50_01128 [Salinomyces thailandica]